MTKNGFLSTIFTMVAAFSAPVHAGDFCPAPSQSAPQASQTSRAPSGMPSRSIAEFYKGTFSERQYFLFGDTDHSDHRIHDYFYSPAHIDHLAAQGVKHIFLERSPHSQQGIDDLIAGTITPQGFAEKYSGGKMWDRQGADEARIRMAQGIVYAAGKGMAIHGANLFTKGIATREERMEMYRFFGEMSAAFAKECPDSSYMPDEFSDRYWSENIGKLSLTPERFAQIMREERDNDTGRTEFIKEKAGMERSAVIFGAAHFSDAPQSIKTLLGPENTVHIDLFPEVEKIEATLAESKKADFIFVIDTARAYKYSSLDFHAKPSSKNSTKPVP